MGHGRLECEYGYTGSLKTTITKIHDRSCYFYFQPLAELVGKLIAPLKNRTFLVIFDMNNRSESSYF